MHSLAIDAVGDVWAWGGGNDRGQLGDGTLVDRAFPVPVAGLPLPAIAIAAAGKHSLALLQDGRVFGWGDNARNQVIPRNLEGTEDFYAEPIASRDANGAPYVDILDIAAGSEHNMALRSDHQIRLWGSNSNFELASNGTLRSNTVDLPTVDAVAIAAGDGFSLAVANDGSAWAWGRSEEGQLGAAVRQPRQFEPIDIGFVSGVVGVGAGSEHTLLILDDGNIGGLGSNSSAQLGDGSLETPIAQPTRPPFLLNVVAADGGMLHSLALQANRQVYAWGSNGFGQASDSGNQVPNNAGSVLQLVPVRVNGVPASAGIAAGRRHSLSIGDDCGQVWAWGDDSVAQLGSGNLATSSGYFRAEPEPVFGLGESGLPAGCSVLLSLAARGDGRISAASTSIQDADCSEVPCIARVAVDDVVSLSAVPDLGSGFVGWGGAAAVARIESCL